ncbi:MAG TPA: EamA family transporter, partial [Nostocaceae cyanobacterium]|nr:EamA family transporter [Nostocaceae cyanobacterium]
MEIIFNNFLIVAISDGKGELAALMGAGLWAIASVVYGVLGQQIPPLQLNFIKGTIAISLLCVTIIITGDLALNLTPLPILLLLLSGAVGIGLGDTAFLAA